MSIEKREGERHERRSLNASNRVTRAWVTAEAPTRKSAQIGAIFGAAGVEKVDLSPTLHLLALFFEW